MPQPRENEPEPNPGPEDDPPIHAIFRFLIAAAITWAANWVIGNLAFGVLRDNLLLADVAYRVLCAAVLIAIYCLLLILLDHCGSGRLAAQGLPLGGLACRQFLVGTALGTLLIGCCVALVAVSGGYQAHVTVTAHTLCLGFEVLLLLLGGALLEEVMFRGYPFQRLLESVGPFWAVTAAAALFGAAHLGNPNAGGVRSWAFLNTIIIGVLLALAYLRSRALWFPFGIHFGWNFALGFLFGLPVSGMSDFGVVVSGTARGSQWLTGGAYGLENSGLAAILLTLSLFIVFRMGNMWRAARPTPELQDRCS